MRRPSSSPRPVRLGAALMAGLTASALVLAGCSSNSTSSSASADSSAAESAAPADAMALQQGGTVVIGAEQEPDCMDWIASCAGSIWGSYMAQVTTIPVVFNVRKAGEDWVPEISGIMASEPVVSAGPPQTVTYKLNPDAVWSDGTPITSADLKYTALAIRDGEDILDKTGYAEIADIATPDPQTAVVTFAKEFAGWKLLFSGSSGVLPSHLLDGKDRPAIMNDGYTWSGGPWIIESWKKGESITLVPNNAYWGDKPKLDKVVFQFTADTAAAFQAFKSGQLDAIYPTPQLDAIDQIKAGIPGAKVQVEAVSGNLEALWMNNAKPLLKSTAVRQALSYSIDRAAIVERLYGPLNVKSPAQSFYPPILSAFGGQDFSTYGLDLAKVEQIMTADGWAKDADGLWAKAGTQATLSITTIAGNKRRELMEQVLQQQLKTAGFGLTIENSSAPDLFGKVLPDGDFDLGIWTLVTTFPDPSLSFAFDSGNIPSEANEFSGLNYSRTDVPGLNDLLATVDRTTDSAARLAATKDGDVLLAESATSLPIAAVPNVLLILDKIGGPTSINPSEGPFWNLQEWGLIG
ncbi:MAG: peptide ABC transporter substrate-binding protein [Actinobacteria bacterium]|nr:peptide ABC transporter substrate-binding protein [Actinomycetota bacterium]